MGFVKRPGGLVQGRRLRWALLASVASAAGLGAGAVAQATNHEPPPPSVSVSAPSQPNASGDVTFTASGYAPEAGALRVFSGPCQATVPSSGSIGANVPVAAAGSFSGIQMTARPTGEANCVYLVNAAGARVAAASLTVPFTASVSFASVEPVRPTRAFVEGGTAKFSLTASSTFPRILWVWLVPGGGACPGTSTAAQTAGGRPVASRPAARAHSLSGWQFTVFFTGEQRLCAYLINAAHNETPAAADGSGFTAVAPTAPTLTITPATASPIEDQAINVTLGGTTEVPRRVALFARRALSGDCSPTWTAERDKPAVIRLGFDGEVINTFSLPATLTPDGSGRWLLCAYLHRPDEETAVAAAQRVLDVREPNGTLAISVKPAAAPGQPNAITATGSVEAKRKLYV
ncbi:MAG TPA: hypothetical protein VD931_08915, partial [Baekduia sp.]|nr:hypothetical protein [Baekduia sp.]